jgi:hypothetical protein
LVGTAVLGAGRRAGSNGEWRANAGLGSLALTGLP